MQVTNIFFPKKKFKAAQPQDPCRLCSSFYFRYDSCQTDVFLWSIILHRRLCTEHQSSG